MRKLIYLRFPRLDVYFISFSFFATLFVLFLNYESRQSGFFITNALIILICLVGLFLRPNELFSLRKIVYVFFLIFFGFIPLNDIYHENLYWGGLSMDNINYFITNIFILIGLIFFIMGCNFNIKENYNFKFNFNSDSIFIGNDLESCYKSLGILLISIFISIIIFNNYNYSYFDLLLRAKNADLICIQMDCQSQSFNSEIFDYFIRPIPFLIFLIYWVYRPQLKMRWFSTIPGLIGGILFFIAIITNAPTALPRFLVATLYIPLLLIFFRKIFFRRYIFTVTLIISLFLIFPFLDNFRYYYSPNFQLGINFDFLNSGHFDGYQNFVRAVSISLVTYGYQLLGVILFWFPRSYWPNKPEGSGFLLAHLENLSLDNISFPYIAEGYVNFGILGVSIFCIVLGLVVSRMDYVFWSKNQFYFGRFYFVLYLLSIGLLFMILRGNLLSSFAYSVSVLASYYFSFRIVNFILSCKFK